MTRAATSQYKSLPFDIAHKTTMNRVRTLQKSVFCQTLHHDDVNLLVHRDILCPKVMSVKVQQYQKHVVSILVKGIIKQFSKATVKIVKKHNQ